MTDAHKLIERLAERAAERTQFVRYDKACRGVAETFAPLAEAIEALRRAEHVLIVLSNVNTVSELSKERARDMALECTRALVALDALMKGKQ